MNWSSWSSWSSWHEKYHKFLERKCPSARSKKTNFTMIGNAKSTAYFFWNIRRILKKNHTATIFWSIIEIFISLLHKQTIFKIWSHGSHPLDVPVWSGFSFQPNLGRPRWTQQMSKAAKINVPWAFGSSAWIVAKDEVQIIATENTTEIPPNGGGLVREIPAISGKPRLVKYYNLASSMDVWYLSTWKPQKSTIHVGKYTSFRGWYGC